MRFAVTVIIACLTTACSDKADRALDFNENLKTVFKSKPEGSSRAVALMKNGIGGPDWLATIHGYADNESVCKQFIEPYNSDPTLSSLPGQYYCETI